MGWNGSDDETQARVGELPKFAPVCAPARGPVEHGRTAGTPARRSWLTPPSLPRSLVRTRHNNMGCRLVPPQLPRLPQPGSRRRDGTDPDSTAHSRAARRSLLCRDNRATPRRPTAEQRPGIARTGRDGTGIGVVYGCRVGCGRQRERYMRVRP